MFGQFEPNTQQLGHAPGLRATAAAVVGRMAIADLRRMAETARIDAFDR